MADMVLSPLVDAVIGTLMSALIEKVRMIWQVDDDLDTLSKALKKIQRVTADAEEMQITKRTVKDWLGELKDVAYKADDVLDELAYEAFRQLAEAENKGKRKEVSSFLRSCSCFRSNPVSFRLDIAERIMVINEKLDRISREREIFSIKENDGRRVLEHDIERPLTSSLMTVPEFEFFGRDKDKEEIITLLVSDSSCGGKQVSVISIIGMGGLGKTTLAQLAYNDKNIENHFDIRAWVCVSEDFDVLRLTKEILESATRKSCGSLAIDPVQRDLQEILTAKRFLIVLDDVWNEERTAWDRLCAPFSVGARGSKIIVTTQDKGVSRSTNADHFYLLKCLAFDDCLSLFLRHAFARESCNAQPKFMEIGKELVGKRFQGLPLAAKALGGLLSSKREIKFWKNILNSQIWSLMENESNVLKAMRVSYHHLPPQIKWCFAYCSIFPKDYKFDKDKLVRLWMAQSFILPRGGMSLEETGSEYFNFLLSRSFFQREEEYPNTRYKMYDCIHDLAESISSDKCFRIENGKLTCILRKGNCHSLFIVMDNDEKIVCLEDLYKCNYAHLSSKLIGGWNLTIKSFMI